MTLLTLVVIGMNIGCEDRIDSPVVNTPEGEPMMVTLNVDLADEADGASLYPNASTKADKGEAFSAQLLPATHTKADTKPTSLHNLEIRQYNYTTGAYMNGETIGTTTIGALLTLTLTASDQCRLVIIARGEGNTVPALGNKSFSEVQSVLADTAVIKSISTDGTDINKMPYILYLPNVKVADNKIQSPDGTDVRLRLKRLAVKLSLNWTFGETMTKDGYVLNEVRLFQVPANYRILPAPESTTKWGTVYPSSVSNFIDGFRLKGDELSKASGSRTIWMPANAQGSSSAIVSPNLRSKRRVNPATTYAEFVVDNADKKERFYFRVYLGGNTTTDFNLFENTDYNWSVNINSVKYTTDDRISLLDQTPVISNNLQPTANCFMMQPGTNICFNPYKHEAGTGGWNTELTSDGTISKTIKKVKVLWQTKDAGTSGDLVMGYVVDDTNHQNLVNLSDGSDINKARIHVKVPNTNGGNAVIAAYGDDEINALWSWHIWISDYVPVGLKDFTAGNATARWAAIKTAKAATTGGTVHTYDAEDYSVPAWTNADGAFHKSVVMDRNLGATRGVYSLSSLDAARTFGNIYEWGRKDPFLGSVDGTSVEINFCYDGDGMPISIKKEQWGKGSSATNEARLYAIAHPGIYLTSPNTSNAVQFPSDSWNTTYKTLYDPCPKGWKVPDLSNADNQNMYKTFQSRNNKGALEYLIAGEWKTGTTSKLTANQFMVTNGFLYYPKTGSNTTDDDRKSDKAVWFPAIRLREFNSGSLREPFLADGSFKSDFSPAFLFWGVGKKGNIYHSGVNVETKIVGSGSISYGSNYHSYGWSVRCIQQ